MKPRRVGAGPWAKGFARSVSEGLRVHPAGPTEARSACRRGSGSYRCAGRGRSTAVTKCRVGPQTADRPRRRRPDSSRASRRLRGGAGWRRRERAECRESSSNVVVAQRNADLQPPSSAGGSAGGAGGAAVQRTPPRGARTSCGIPVSATVRVAPERTSMRVRAPATRVRDPEARSRLPDKNLRGLAGGHRLLDARVVLAQPEDHVSPGVTAAHTDPPATAGGRRSTPWSLARAVIRLVSGSIFSTEPVLAAGRPQRTVGEGDERGRHGQRDTPPHPAGCRHPPEPPRRRERPRRTPRRRRSRSGPTRVAHGSPPSSAP